MNQPKELVKLAYNALSDKKGGDIKVIDIHEVSVLADYFLIADGSNINQVQAMADHVQEVLGRAVSWLEGDGQGESQDAGARLAQLLLSGPEGVLLEACVGLEKWEREALGELLDETTRQLLRALTAGADPRRVTFLTGRLRQLRQALAYNVGAGHIAGWLCAGACPASPLSFTTETMTR